jgi:predicted CXXCH cytochrome family protein
MEIDSKIVLNRKTARNTIFISLFILFFLLFHIRTTEASWWIDVKKFQVSAHGDMACMECHEDIFDQDLHPNPDNVNKRLKDFFDMNASCLDCHDDTLEDLEEGIHGAEKVEDPKEYEDCIGCHHPHYQEFLDKDKQGQIDAADLPPFSEEDIACLTCHQAFRTGDPQLIQKVIGFCFHCHGLTQTELSKESKVIPPLINQSEYLSTPHAETVCTACHPQAAAYNHASQIQGDCRPCHRPHDEKVAHDAHIGVACESCHLSEILPIRDPELKTVRWEKPRRSGTVSKIHQMPRLTEETECQRCHFKGNPIGAVSMILPPKSLLCMPCHPATFSIGDTITILALIVFVVGLAMTASLWISGTLPGKGKESSFSKTRRLLGNNARNIFTSKIVKIVKTLFYDVLLQRRLYKRSAIRWFIHSLIFFPFVLRFIWGIVALLASIWFPQWHLVWSMLDKNHPLTAVLFDLTGIIMMLGIVLALLRGGSVESDRPPGLPRQDRVALGLIGGIVVVGFILEGMRIAMVEGPADAVYAIVGFGISRLFWGVTGLTDAYGYLWYVHAILTAVFVAYLPFSRLMHIIMAPVVLVMNAVLESE